MTNPYVLPKDLLHEVILRTIEFDNLSNEIIRTAFGLEIEWGGEENSEPQNINELNMFKDYFLDNLGSSSRADILSDIVDDLIKGGNRELKICKDFKGKVIKFYKIRNIFAHNIFPKGLDGYTKLDSKEPYWGELSKQHKELYSELREFLWSNCYKEIKLK